jgi:EmrB/QacA subfamily drug resistance transporter
MLILARAVQGLGAALLVPGSLALISASFPEETRGRAIGTWSGFTAITAAIGPVIGGWLVEHASWRWVFFLNLPLAVAVVGFSLTHLPESRNEGASHHLDWPGALLATVGLGAVTYALIEFPNRAAQAPHLIVLAALAGVAALAGFLVAEARSRAPMVSLALFRSRNFSGANLLTLFLYAALGGMLFFLPMNLIQVQHESATEAGAALLPMVLLLFALSRWSGGLVARYGARLPLTIGPLIFAAGVAGFARQGLGGSYWTTVFPATVVMGFGMTLCVAPLTTTVMNAVDQAEAGVASGVNNAVSRIGGLLAVAVFGVVLLAGFNRGLDRRLDRLALSPQARQRADAQRPLLAAASNPDPRVQRAVAESFVAGYRWVIWVSVALGVVSSGCAFWWIDPVPEKTAARPGEA